jgi:8-oxo-dGTP pyrophosphatase MutT (NUDIX family)
VGVTTEDTGGTADALQAVVAVVLKWRGRTGLFLRSKTATHDPSRWHCITGYVEPGTTPWQQAVQELFEETGLTVADLTSLAEGRELSLADVSGQQRTVHTFQAMTHVRRLRLNDEHDEYRWVAPDRLPRFGNRVRWLGEVLDAVP